MCWDYYFVLWNRSIVEAEMFRLCYEGNFPSILSHMFCCKLRQIMAFVYCFICFCLYMKFALLLFFFIFQRKTRVSSLFSRVGTCHSFYCSIYWAFTNFHEYCLESWLMHFIPMCLFGKLICWGMKIFVSVVFSSYYRLCNAIHYMHILRMILIWS